MYSFIQQKLLTPLDGWSSLTAKLVKNLPAMQETPVRPLGWENPMEKGKATHSSILAWGIPRTVKSMGSQRVGHDWATFTFRWLVRPNSILVWFPFSYLLEQEVLEQQQISCAWHRSIQMSVGTERITQNPGTNWVPMINTSSTQM